MSNTTFKLVTPVTWDGEEVSELEFVRPKGKHLKRMPAEASIKDLMQLAAKVTVSPKNISPAFFDEVDGADVVNIAEVMGDFLTVGQGTGQN